MKLSPIFRVLTTGLVCFSLVTAVTVPSVDVYAQERQAAPRVVSSDLSIMVLKGEDGVNIINKKSSVKPVVLVVDKNNLPVSGALVTFAFPDSGGASGLFSNGSRTVSVVTKSGGRATISSFRPVGEGKFNIQVTANFRGQTATKVITQTNYPTVDAAVAAGKTVPAIHVLSGTSLGIVAGAAAAAGIAVAVLKKGGGGTTITAGPPIVHLRN
jgi:hypothetical protein